MGLSSGPSSRLADLAADLHFNDIPVKVLERTKINVLDTLGVCFGGSQTAHADQAMPVVRQYRRIGRAPGGIK